MSSDSNSVRVRVSRMVKSHGEQDGFMRWRRSLFLLLSIVAVTMAIVMVVYKSNWDCSQSHPVIHHVTEVVQEHAFPADCMPAARPVSAVRLPPVPLSGESRVELRKSAPAGSGRGRHRRHRAATSRTARRDRLDLSLTAPLARHTLSFIRSVGRATNARRPHQVSGIAYLPNIQHKCDRFVLLPRTNRQSKSR